ncbi:type VI secretion system baseplate subunit TssG [Massilia litorea]|uniref:Type VI secretion system baseplate subunit TssG n=1 Tax=Massilia litorea TaxID=2769491 RepID=A0A7L9U2C5_9BURK|nr:type VI secretion system baseplate subunit TssG [Massilia litorea]QOL49221.1 type VI secretion system baseplate subunit TssG [Massilia litorea]
MPPTQRREIAPLIERLLAAPHTFEFVQAVSILLAWLAERGVPSGQALRERLRFENSLGLGFPASEIEAIARIPDGSEGDRFSLTPAFMGLLGVHGALPLHVTERIAAWQGGRDDAAPRAFLDLVSNRMLALFYRAWQKSRVEHMAAGREGDPDRFRPLLLALAGCPPGRPPGAPPVPDGLIAHFAGLLQQRPRPGVVLARLLSDYLGVAVELEEAVGYWDRLHADEQAALGVNAELGENVLLGARSWRPDLRARLRIGPLDAAAFAHFLPSGAGSALLRAILRRFAEPTVGFEVQLVLRAQEVRPVQLAGPAGAAARLGRDSFLVSSTAQADRADMRYLVLPMAPLGARG